MQNTRCQCCCPVAGVDGFLSWYNFTTGCCTGMSPTYGLAYQVGGVTLANLQKYRIIYCGDYLACDNVITPRLVPEFNAFDWPTVAQYVQGGGRLWLQGEWGSSARHGIFPICMSPSNATRINNFMTALGATMQIVPDDLVTGSFLTPGAANIALGVASVWSDFASQITLNSGTSVFVTAAPMDVPGSAIVGVEKVGNGFVFLSTDSNIGQISGPAPTFCDFVKRLTDYTDAQII